MADSDPENEISDIERPKDRPLDPGDSKAVPHLIGPGAETYENDRAKKSHKRKKPDRRVANRPQKIRVDFPFGLKIHFNIASANRSLSAACRDRQAISFRETSAKAAIPRFPDRSSPQTRALRSDTIAHGRLDLTILNFAIFSLRLIFHCPDSLHAKRALLDHADFAHRHVWIQLKFEGPFPDGISEVKEPHIVRACVRTVARAAASVVDLRVKTFFVMVTGVGRANRLTRSGIALLAHYGSEFHPHIRKFPFVIPFNSNPSDRSSFRGLLRTCNTNIVLCPAR